LVAEEAREAARVAREEAHRQGQMRIIPGMRLIKNSLNATIVVTNMEIADLFVTKPRN
jgi:hypothetical protein